MKQRSKIFDVIVVGGGPGGSVAAKMCATEGLHTILLEKKKLPREKVCSGMVMGPWANDIIEDVFGAIPHHVLVAPYYLSGHMIHLPGCHPRRIEYRTPLAWRRDLDHWMNLQAKEAGVTIMDRAKVVHVDQKKGSSRVTVEGDSEQKVFRGRYVIGADGAGSRVRKSLFPDLKVHYSTPIRECYEGGVDLDHDYIHWFFPKSAPRPRFDLLHKGNSFVLEGSGIPALREEINTVLSAQGFDIQTKPVWRDGCMMPQLHHELVSGAFSPASGNVLLIGDAACLVFPITFEGIGAAVKSGLLAAQAITVSLKLTREAAPLYLNALKPVIHNVGHLYSVQRELQEQAWKEPNALADALKGAYEETLKVR